MIDLSALSDTLRDHSVAVAGLGKSGLSAIRALIAAGMHVYAHDDDLEKQEVGIKIGALPFSKDFDELSNCAFLLLSPGIPLHFPHPHPLVLKAREKQIEIIGDIELFSRIKSPCITVGITGTNGKSTTTALIAHILNHTGHKGIACGNLGLPVLDINLSDPAGTVVVIELSSFQLDLCPTFTPDIAVHLNLTPDHIDRHGSLENYIAVKEKIFLGSGTGFCGVDDDPSRAMFLRAKENKKRRMIPVSCQNAMNDGLYMSGSDITDDVFEGGIIGSLSNLLTLRGRHNYQNALMAYGVARTLGIGVNDIFHAFETYPGLSHRQITVRTINGVEYINDSKATNADATEKALLTFDRIHWIVGGLPKAGGVSGLEPYAAKIRHAYLIGTSSEDFSLFMRKNNIPFTFCETIETAVSSAHEHAQKEINATKKPGTVLLSPACASYDQFKSYEHRGDVFTHLVNDLPDARAEAL